MSLQRTRSAALTFVKGPARPASVHSKAMMKVSTPCLGRFPLSLFLPALLRVRISRAETTRTRYKLGHWLGSRRQNNWMVLGLCPLISNLVVSSFKF